jgi:hypothetical protein
MISYINIYYKPIVWSMSLPDAVNYAMNEIMIEEVDEVVEVVADEDVDNRLILDSSSSFDVILNKKIDEINELYELKTKNKKMISNVNEINFMDKKLYNKINAAIDKKYKESKQYKKKCEEEVQNAL